MGQKNFLHQQEETAELLSSLLKQLAEAHKKENIFQAELTEERLPEKSWRRSFRLSASDSAGKLSLEGRIPRRPTYLMKPERVEVTGGSVHIRKKPFKILRWSENVERITGGWLHSDQDPYLLSHDRNYYQVEIETGTVLSIFQTPLQEYFLHGYFG
jgi:hypothetical protein